jgi:hypothetical protein
MKYAWIQDEKIRDICQGGNPQDCYTPNVAAYYDIEWGRENGPFVGSEDQKNFAKWRDQTTKN